MPATHSTSGTIILARRFSRREFWADIRRSKANAILYIGEMLRYLVQAPPDPRFPDEQNHDVDLAFGLGLSPTVWRGVRERFGIPWIVEYYSASEATTSLVNSNKNDRGVGKVSHWGPLMRSVGQDTFYIVRTDLESGDILRDPKTGFCIRTQPGEVGESICRITPPFQRRHDYVGEGGKEATEKKVLRDVFKKGDEFFRLGDAMVIVSRVEFVIVALLPTCLVAVPDSCTYVPPFAPTSTSTYYGRPTLPNLSFSPPKPLPTGGLSRQD